MHRRSRAIWPLVFALATLAAPAARADEASEVGRLAAAASGESALSRLTDRLAAHTRGLGAAATPPQLESAADALGALVARAQELEVGAALYVRFVSLSGDLANISEEVRARLEDGAGEDDAALESLFRSKNWQRLDYADAMLGYWAGWAQLSRGRLLAPGSERRAAMQKARAAFARSSYELRLPQIATASLLGIGIALHDLGDLAGAQSTLEALERQLALEGDSDLLAPALYELATVAYEKGDIEAGARVSARLPAMTPRQKQVLRQLEAEAWLKRAKTGGEGADRAAALLRGLAAEGGEAARWAAAVAAANWNLLEGRDVGPIGELLRAEADFDAGRYAESGDAYARLLAQPVPGLDLATARYKFAVSLAETGSVKRAASELERLLADGGGAPVREPAAALFHALAEQLARDEPGTASDRRALAASRILLKVQPEGPGAGLARLRVARAAPNRSLGELEKIAPESPAYPTALLDRVRVRSAQLQRRDAAGRSVRAEARKLAADLDAVRKVIAAGRLEPEPRRDATLAVLRAKAAAWSGGAPDAVLARIDAAEGQPSLGSDEKRALLRLRLRTLIRAKRYKALEGLLAARSGGQVRREWPIWHEALLALAAQPAPARTQLVWYARLEPLVPEGAEMDFALGRARSLLGAGRTDEALSAAQTLVTEHPRSGDARLLYARALDATGAHGQASQAWLEVAGGVEIGTPRWIRAQLAAASASRGAGDLGTACNSVAALHEAIAEPEPRVRAQLETLGKDCPPPEG